MLHLIDVRKTRLRKDMDSTFRSFMPLSVIYANVRMNEHES